MKVLVCCEESQTVCVAFRQRGHEAYSCDVQQCSGGHPEWHICRDVIELINGNAEFKTLDGQCHVVEEWDLLICHPPCTYLSNAGACRLYRDGQLNVERYKQGMDARAFFMEFYNSSCKRIAIENPTPSKIYSLPPPTQIIQPFMFGEAYTKRTLLWLKNLPLLWATDVVVPEKTWIASDCSKNAGTLKNKDTKRSAKERSKTFAGIANAMAAQWG